jgi:hypothetical protein
MSYDSRFRSRNRFHKVKIKIFSISERLNLLSRHDVVARRSKLSIATTSVVAIKRKLSIFTIRLYLLSDLSYRGNNTNFVYCHDMRFRTKFHRRCLGKLLNRVKLHVHNSRIIFLVNYTVKLNFGCDLQIKFFFPDGETIAMLTHGGINR